MKFPGLLKKRVVFSVFLVVMTWLCLTGTPLASSGGEHGEDHGTKGWVATDTYRVMNFAVLAAALFFILRKPISQALNGRIRDIQDQLSDLEAKKAEAEKKLAEYDKKIASLDKEAETIIAEYIKQGQEAHKNILEASKKEAAKLEDQAKRKIDHEFNQARQELQAEILEKALARAEALLKEKITSEDQDRLVDEYLDKVVAQ